MDKKKLTRLMDGGQDRLPKNLQKAFELQMKAVDRTYTDRLGNTYTEKPAAYNSMMTKAMEHDMITLPRIGTHMYGDAIAKAENWYGALHEMDDALMRMKDDAKAGRKLIDFPNEKAETLMNEMAELSHDTSLSKAGKKLLDTWFERILYMIYWSFVLKEEEMIREDTAEASMRAFDEDGNLCMGISEKDEEAVKVICAMKKILNQTLLRLPVMSDEVFVVADKLENLDIAVKAILRGKVKELEYLAKCAEAAKEFAAADNE